MVSSSFVHPHYLPEFGTDLLRTCLVRLCLYGQPNIMQTLQGVDVSLSEARRAAGSSSFVPLSHSLGRLSGTSVREPVAMDIYSTYVGNIPSGV